MGLVHVISVAKRFESEHGVVRLSLGEAIRRVLQEQPRTELAKAINSHLKSGLTVPDEMAVGCLEVMLMTMACQTRGYVLPITKSHWRKFCSNNLHSCSKIPKLESTKVRLGQLLALYIAPADTSWMDSR